MFRSSVARVVLLLVVLLAITGCGPSPEFTAFVRAADGFHASVAPVASVELNRQRAAAKTEGERLAIDARLDELIDFRRAIDAAKQRVGTGGERP